MKLVLLLSFIVFSSMTSAFSFRKSILKRSQIESITAEMLNDWYGVQEIKIYDIDYVGTKFFDPIGRISDMTLFSPATSSYNNETYTVEFEYDSQRFKCYANDYYNYKRIIMTNCNITRNFKRSGGKIENALNSFFKLKKNYVEQENRDQEFIEIRKGWADEISMFVGSGADKRSLTSLDFWIFNYTSYTPKPTVIAEEVTPEVMPEATPELPIRTLDEKISLKQCLSVAAEFSGSTAENRQRWECYNNLKPLNFRQCRVISDAMYGTNSENRMRAACLGDLIEKNAISFDQCLVLSDDMYGTNDENRQRWNCYNHLKASLSFKQCRVISEAMYGTNSENRMRVACVGDLLAKNAITFDQCLGLAQDMYGTNDENRQRWNCYNSFKPLSLDQCRKVSNSMYGSNSKDRMRSSCLND